MASSSNVVRVPKPAKSSFNPNRLLEKNLLLKNQVEHFHRLELELAPEKRTGVDFGSLKTEGQAAEYIRKMTEILHPQAARSGGR